MGTVTTGPSLGSSKSYGYCSPVTEFYNTAIGADFLFLSVWEGAEAGCSTASIDGCVMSFNVTSPSSFGLGTLPSGTQNLSSDEYEPATGGIIVDNGVSTPAGTSQIYFETLNVGTTPCTGICAVQASQTAP
jgi:hypothetical protein